MSFNNSGLVLNSQYNNAPVNISQITLKSAPQKNISLNAPMIGRVYNAKPGCSACGKKVS